jgi:hypothetical protein
MHRNSLREWLDLVAREIGRDEFIALLKSVALWGCLGAAIGTVFGVAAYRAFRRCGWYAATSTAGRWLQRGLGALVVLLCAALIGGAGVWESIHRRCHDAITRSRIGSDVLTTIADLVAEGFAWIDLALQPGESRSTDATDARVAEFRAGAWEIDAAVFLQRIDALREGTFQGLLAGFEQEVLKKTPALKGGLTEKLLHQTIQGIGPALLERKLSSEMRRRGLDHLQAAIRTRLIAEAARSGNPATIGYRDLSGFFLREGIVPAIVFPIRSLARQQQIIYILLAAGVALVPAGVCRAGRKKAGAGANQPAPRTSVRTESREHRQCDGPGRRGLGPRRPDIVDLARTCAEGSARYPELHRRNPDDASAFLRYARGMTTALPFTVAPLAAAFLPRVRERGLDDQQQPVVRLAAQGGEPLRDLLRRARPGEEIILASYCPFARPGPFREFGPIYVSARGGPAEPESIFARRTEPRDDYFQRQLTLRAYDGEGAIADAAIVDFETAPARLDDFLDRPGIDFVDARFPSYGCFAARFLRSDHRDSDGKPERFS